MLRRAGVPGVDAEEAHLTDGAAGYARPVSTDPVPPADPDGTPPPLDPPVDASRVRLPAKP